MNEAFTPDGWGQILRTQSAHGRTSYLIKGAGFEGWYDGLQVQSDFADSPDDVVPNEENETILPYPSRPQGPGWDGTNSTIQPGIDPHIEMDGNSDSLTGESTDADAVGADLDGLFEPHSHLAGSRPRRLHFAASDDPILDVSALPGESPTGLKNSPINPDGVDTDDLFDGSLPHFERESAYDHLVILDDLSFMKFASDDEDGDGDDDKKKHHREQGPSFLRNNDNDDDDDDDSDGDSDSEDSDSDSSDGDSDGGDGGHTASFLTTTADLHFLANFCRCGEALPLHSQSEHRELQVEAGKPTIKGRKKHAAERSAVEGVNPQDQDLENLLERYQQDNFNYQESNLRNLVDRSQDDGDNAGNLNNYASVQRQADDGYDKYIGSNGDGTYHLIASGGGKLPKGQQYGHYDSHQDAHDAVEAIIARNHAHASTKTAAPAADPGPTQIESQVEQLMQFWAVDNNNWWHWTGAQSDLALLNQMQQQMMAVGAPGGPPGQMQAQSSFRIEANTPEPWREYLQILASDRLVALAAWADVVQKSKRLRAEGAIALEVFKPEVITAFVQGDNGRYYTTVQRLGSVAPGVGRQLTSTQVSGWSCECDWGHWAWIRKRSFVGRMCSHAYALFSEMRSLDAKARKGKGRPLSAGKFAAVTNKAAWTRVADGGFSWVSDDPAVPTAAIARTASGWNAQVWSDGTSVDSLNLGTFSHSEQARRVASRAITAHLAAAGDVTMVGDPSGSFPPYGTPDSISGGYADPYSEDGAPEPLVSQDGNGQGDPGVQDSTTRYGSFPAFAESKDGDDNEGPEEEDNGIEEEDEPDDDESLDEEIAEDEDDSDDGQDDEGDEPQESDDDDHNLDDIGHDEPHRREDEGTDNPGDDSDDDSIEKHSSVVELQQQFGLSHLAGSDYSLADQNKLVREAEGQTARNRGDLNLTGTHYEAASGAPQEAEDVLAFLF
jgi:hypothetical protein